MVLEAPAGTVTLAGTVTEVRLELRPIVKPPSGATPPRVTVPWVVVPPTTVSGPIIKSTANGITKNVARIDVDPNVAVTEIFSDFLT